ncbi:MAG: bifunctional 2-polyprenyl-6-hydroxyphenol methylase/3-demethylubiquinol 3-O-methyltransferase UbiG [Hyphomicrobium sp.]|nr:bifunctional 2-polyprenyl-6-hydroxyphenol methylase/3-demethylubiquinol 3-O-methyltransferase UbiG [Hyphomicrobium sp.]
MPTDLTEPDTTRTTENLDPAEVERFRRMASEWWDPNGKFRPLHQLGPPRLQFVRDELAAHFGREAMQLRPLRDLRVLDVGCGGGLVSEPLTRMGAAVTGIDPGRENVEIARAHAATSNLAIDYRVATVEQLAKDGTTFDAVVCLEVVEHVPDVDAFVAELGRLVRPGGLLILSTINRNLKSFALAIVGAEYVLGWLPRGTHQWDRFVTPDELSRAIAKAGLLAPRFKGLVYDPMRDRWTLSNDTDVNYLGASAKPNS